MTDLITCGYLGIPKSWFSHPKSILNVKRELTFTTRDYLGNRTPPIFVWEEDEERIYVPRFYHKYSDAIEPEIQQRINMWHAQDAIELSGGMNYPCKSPIIDFDVKTELKEERGQVDAYKAMVKYLTMNEAGILQAFTGCGKTILGLTIAAAFKRPIGVFVYNEHMLKNWVDTAKLVFGYSDDEIGIVQGPRCDIGKPVTIMMVQSLYTKDDIPQELLDHIGFVLADEINRYGCEVWQSVVSLFKTPYRLGMSADPRRKDGLDRIITYNFGKVGHVVPDTAKQALPLVVQVEVTATYRKAHYLRHYGNAKGSVDTTAYKKLLADDKRRNDLIVSMLMDAAKKGRSILVFSHLRDHVTLLYDYFTKAYSESGIKVKKRIALFMGGTKAGSRNSTIEESMSAPFIFTTYAFARDALNLPQIDTLFLTSPCGDPLQPIGRLRDGPGKMPLLALDFYEMNEHSQDAANKRKKRYVGLGLEVKRVKRSLTKGRYSEMGMSM